MKKWICFLLSLAALLLTACGNVDTSGDMDVDLTKLSGTVAYSELYNITNSPGNYIGKSIRIRGQSQSFYYDATGKVYHSVTVADAASCCAQGVEYILPEGEVYPADNVTITISGIFDDYVESGNTYYHLTGVKWTD